MLRLATKKLLSDPAKSTVENLRYFSNFQGRSSCTARVENEGVDKLLHEHSKLTKSPQSHSNSSFVSSHKNGYKSLLNPQIWHNEAKRTFLTSCRLRKAEDRKQMLASMPVKDEGTSGERVFDLDLAGRGKAGLFPDENTPNLLFDGMKFDEVPICHVRVSKNNCIIDICQTANSSPAVYHSCGIEGFKHTRKGTNIAAQATAVTTANKAIAKGIKTVRVKIAGIGPGRMSSIKGLQMGGLNIISITDSTPISFNPPRPRKQRRL